jgi:hypothetical protein
LIAAAVVFFLCGALRWAAHAEESSPAGSALPPVAFSEDPDDWSSLIIDLGNLVHVRIYGKVTSGATPVPIGVDTEGLRDVKAVIGDSRGYPVESRSQGEAGGRYLIIEGTAASEEDALAAVVKSVAYSLDGLEASQFTGSPIRVDSMARLDSSLPENASGGGGGCGLGSAALPAAVLVCAVWLSSWGKRS